MRLGWWPCSNNSTDFAVGAQRLKTTPGLSPAGHDGVPDVVHRDDRSTFTRFLFTSCFFGFLVFAGGAHIVDEARPAAAGFFGRAFGRRLFSGRQFL